MEPSNPIVQNKEKLVDKVVELIGEIKKEAKRRPKRKIIRNMQTALNTITVNSSVKVNDIAQEKIKAIAS